MGELEAALALADRHRDGPVFVEIFLERNDCREALRHLGEMGHETPAQT